VAEENPKDNARTGEQGRDKEKTSFEQFDDLMTKLLAVPKEELEAGGVRIWTAFSESSLFPVRRGESWLPLSKVSEFFF
jgi:hypothetical protein